MGMKIIFSVAFCLLLTGCGGFAFPGSDAAPRVEVGSQVYPGPDEDYEPAPTREQTTSTCTMNGHGAVCR
jgi:hypothetical protein